LNLQHPGYPLQKKIKIKNLPQIELDVYSKISLNKLVVYAVQYLQEQDVTATFEEIISVCFRLFPHSFSMKHYPRWPDSALVIRRLNDAREKGKIKGNPADGFSLKYEGKQLAKRVARALGLVKPAPVKVKKKTAPEKMRAAPVKKQVMKTKVISQKKTFVAPAAQKKSPKLRKPVKKLNTKSIKPARLVGKKKLQKRSAVKNTQPARLSMALPPPQEKIVKPLRPVKQKRKIITPQKEKTAKIAAAVSSHLTREERAKAGKVVRLMESSDAYRHYKKNGGNSRISEFDFRSLLLCTMESPPETLARNVNLFKSYVNIHNRHDLMTFLNFCEVSFASLLKPTGKKIKKKK